jgi:argininosuccinate lyase
MPQKKNPDVPELIRGKSGRVFGHLLGLLTVIKGLPLAYNRDLQEDKVPLFDTVDTLKASLQVMRELVAGIKVDENRLRSAARDGFLDATDLADYLVNRGMSFRSAHEAVGNMVRFCIDQRRELQDLSLGEFRRFSRRIEKDVYNYLGTESAVKRRRTPGGTALTNVRRRLKELGV